MSAKQLARLAVAGVFVGLASGVASAVFLSLLELATSTRQDHRWLLIGLPVWGVAFGLSVHYFAGRSAGGNRRTMTEIQLFGEGVPFRMAPIAFVGTILTHLFGGSAGREGTALQMSAGITDGIGSRLGLAHEERRLLLIAALAGGFASVFGIPFTGAVFALEVSPAGLGSRARAVAAVIPAAIVGHVTVLSLGVTHTHYDGFYAGGVRWSDSLRWLVVAVALGAGALAFPRLIEGVRALLDHVSSHPAVRAALGGAVVVVAALVFSGWDELGLSLPLLQRALDGQGGWSNFALKLALTSVTLGAGFPGGEVTPTFVMGSVLGSTVAGWVGVPRQIAARVGFVALFGAAANAPMAAIVLGVEMFGWRQVPILVGVCIVARVSSGSHHIYEVMDEELFD